ncbi:hypothetical protein AX16_004190 [Volvariella volvacea WC 439]|nr:hypothetical protein AX16_004190 [Volvariella volvacea WC 439]
MSTTLPLFWDLSSASKKERIDASVKLISTLEHFQAQFTPQKSAASEAVSKEEESKSESEDDEDGEHEVGEEVEGSNKKLDGLDEMNAQDVSYSIRRLVRGLASPRESSRLGFAVALTELLSRIDTVTCSQIVTLIMDGTKTQGSMTGQEERDILFARLFGLTAVVQSGLLVRKGTLTTSASTSSEVSSLEILKEVIGQLVGLGEKKSWLRESAWWSISLTVDVLKGSEVAWKGEAVDAMLQSLFADHKAWSPEKVALALKLQTLYPDKGWKDLLTPALKSSIVLSNPNLQALAKILKESGSEDDDEKGLPRASTASWKPQLHFVWDVILDQLLPPESLEPRAALFQDFYRAVVDESLFSATSSPEKKYWGFQVFQKSLKRVDQSSIPMLFTRNFMRSWINHLSNPDRYLHKIAKQAVADVQAFVTSNPHLGFTLILQLTGVNGSKQFDKLTKTKTVENILSSMTADGIYEYINWLLQQVDESDPSDESDAQTINARRAWIIEQFAALFRNGSIPKEDGWIKTVLDWLIVHGLFQIKKKSSKSPFKALHSPPKPIFSDDLRLGCRTRLLTCIGDLTTQTTTVKNGDKVLKATGVASDGEPWVSKVLTSISQLEADEKHVSLLVEHDEEEVQLHAKASSLAFRLSKVSGEQRDVAQGIELLLNAIVLQQYCSGNDEEVDLGTLESCIDAANRMFPEKKSKKARKSDAKKAEGQEDAPEPVDVLVDIIIGFLEKSTSYFRNLANQAFPLISSSVQGSTVDLILSQLERRKPSELAADSDVDEDEMVIDEDGEEEDEEQHDSSDEDSDESEGTSIDEDDDSKDEPVDLELRKKIEEALRINGAAALSDESDEELMDDDQMMAIDEQIASAFRARATEKRAGKDTNAQREATHFKNRVLDLVDIFLHKQPTSNHVVRFVIPLVELIAGTSSDERQLSDKAKGILRSRIGKAKEMPVKGLTKEGVTEISNTIHIRARKVHSPELLPILSQCSIFLSKILYSLGGEGSVIDQYRESLTDYLTRKNSALNTQFFLDFARRCPKHTWSLRDHLLEQAEKAVNLYRRCQAYRILEIIISQLPSFPEHNAEAIQFMGHLQAKTSLPIIQACENQLDISAAQIKDIFKLVLIAIRQTQRILSSSSTEVPLSKHAWLPDKWTSVAEKLSQSTRYKASPALRKMCEQVVQLAQKISSEPQRQGKAAPGKRKVADEEGDEGGSRMGKHKKHKKDKS